MQGIVSLLDETHSRIVEDLWDELQRDFGITAPFSTRFPHFTYSVAESFREGDLTVALEKIAQDLKPFPARTSGLGVFGGERPIVFVTVVRSAQLSELHRRLGKKVSTACSGRSNHYGEDIWIPHITLAEGDVDPAKAAEIIRRWAARPFQWEIKVNNLALLSSVNDKQEVRMRFGFHKQG